MKLHLIGNAHLDPAWMWKWNEGFAAFAATCRSALDRTEETDDFIFTASSAACFEFIEQTDPELFKNIYQAVMNNKWSLVGGWWVEADCNLPSGESFIRQALYGQAYFKSRFGVECDTGYCIDSFGHNANLPMLLHACGMKNYVFMRPQEDEQHLDASLFRWRSPCGDEVTSYRIPLHYSNHELSIKEKVGRLPSYPLYDSEHPWMLFYGVGNHGGGPTKEQLRQIAELQRKDNGTIFSSPSNYFEDVEQLHISLPVFEGEFYPHSIGTYSAHSEVKKLNRIAEQSLLRAEVISTIAEAATKKETDWSAIEEAWKPVLLNQFHDTLGGVCPKEVMDEVILSYSESISVAHRHERIAMAMIASRIDTSSHIESLVVFNPNSFAINTAVEFELWHPDASEHGSPITAVSLETETGEYIPTQLIEPSGKIGGDRVRCMTNIYLPPFGWNTLGIVRQKETKSDPKLEISENRISNGVCTLIVERSDEPAALCYVPAAVYHDFSDTWGHGITGFSSLEGEFKVTRKEIVETGPLRVRLRLTSTYNTSKLVEDFILAADSPYIEHRVYLDWHEQRKVCKLRFAHGITDPSVRYEIPYGSITRRAGGTEVPVGRWAFVEGSSGGVGVVSPYKSSYSCDEQHLGITIARSAIYAHHEPPHRFGDRETVRFLDQGEQEFVNYIFPCQTNWQNARMPHFAEQLCNPPIVQVEGRHNGGLPKLHSNDIAGQDIIITSIKRPHSNVGNNSVILRFYEAYGRQLKANIVSLINSKPSSIEIPPHSVITIKMDESGTMKVGGLA